MQETGNDDHQPALGHMLWTSRGVARRGRPEPSGVSAACRSREGPGAHHAAPAALRGSPTNITLCCCIRVWRTAPLQGRHRNHTHQRTCTQGDDVLRKATGAAVVCLGQSQLSCHCWPNYQAKSGRLSIVELSASIEKPRCDGRNTSQHFAHYPDACRACEQVPGWALLRIRDAEVKTMPRRSQARHGTVGLAGESIACVGLCHESGVHFASLCSAYVCDHDATPGQPSPIDPEPWSNLHDQAIPVIIHVAAVSACKYSVQCFPEPLRAFTCSHATC